jgi:16S rRNA (adenine1518-N6/adenine1519-N6)-dimethyltransferase
LVVAVSIDTTPDGLPPLGSVVRSLGLSARKSLGQHFILDLNLTRRIARAAGPLEGRTVMEVGPGPGGLTRALLLEGAAKVVAVERDERCLPALEAIAARWPGRLDVRLADALGVDWRALMAGGGGAGEARSAGVARSAGKAVIVANLPYNVGTLLLTGWLETEPWPPWFQRMVLMFQREVAERVVAQPGTKAYGRLSVLAQWRTRARLLFTLKPEAFTPPPAVASAVVEFTPLERPSPECKAATLSRLTAAAFGQRRKMLRQSLKPVLADPEPLLAAAGLAPTLRGEVLAVHDFARLAYTLERWAGRR